MYGILCQNVGKYSSPMEHAGYIDIYIYILMGIFADFSGAVPQKKIEDELAGKS